LLIDGYNIINAWKDIFRPRYEPLEDCRDKLLNILSNFQGYRNINIIVVFDAHMVRNSREKQYIHDNLTVVFTKESETADNYIERFVFRLGNIHRIRVATSDYLEQRMILNNGGIRLSPRELKSEIGLTRDDIKSRNSSKGYSKSNMVMSRLDPEMLELLEKIRRGE
jgi:uncharacterized protein